MCVTVSRATQHSQNQELLIAVRADYSKGVQRVKPQPKSMYNISKKKWHVQCYDEPTFPKMEISITKSAQPHGYSAETVLKH